MPKRSPTPDSSPRDYQELFARLGEYLRQRFARLDADTVEDIVQWTLSEFWQEAGQRPPDNPWAYLRRMASNNAIDWIRRQERIRFEQLSRQGVSGDISRQASPAAEVTGRERTPLSQVLEEERRKRQGLLLSEVLQQFTADCQRRPEGGKMKEAYERSVRGQAPDEIAAAMGISKSQVYLLTSRARRWVLRRLQAQDVNRSVFATLLGHQQ